MRQVWRLLLDLNLAFLKQMEISRSTGKVANDTPIDQTRIRSFERFIVQINSDLIGVIPAAGLGTRMGGSLPKALVSVHGRPLLDHAIAALEKLAVSKIVVVIGHPSDAVREYLRTQDFGIEIAFAYQEQRLGLPHAIAMARDILANEFVVLCPDNIFSDLEDLRHAKQEFLSRRPPFLMVATVTPTHQRDRA